MLDLFDPLPPFHSALLWREEVLHPLTVHFPIGLLMVSAALWFLSFCGLKERLRFASDILLILGAIGGWIAVYTGGLAEEVVNGVICDPTITHRHGDGARVSMILLSLALAARVAMVVVARINYRIKFEYVSSFVVSILMLAGSAALIQSAHLGASLVYVQGAAVNHPGDMCEGFE